MNSLVINTFEKLIKQLKLNQLSTKEEKIKYKITKLINALKQIRNLNYELTLENTKGISKLIPDIGKGTERRIIEILETGTLKEVNDENILIIFEDLCNIIGVGAITAHKLIKKYNIISVKDFKNKIKNKTIGNVSNKLLVALKYYKKYKTIILRKTIDEIKQLINKIFNNKVLFVICGSYRRENNTSRDIDILITHKSLRYNKDLRNSNYLETIINKLKESNFIIDDLVKPCKTIKYMGFCKYNNDIMRIDIRVTSLYSYYPALLYFTGSSEFNRYLRKIAIKQGYKLNEYGLYKNNKSIFIQNEKMIFDLLNIHYLTPKERN